MTTTIPNPNGVSANPFFRGRLPVKAATRIDEGNLVMVATGTGYVEGADPQAAMRCIGWAMELTDNSAGAAGDKSVPVSAEPRGFAGKAGDLPTTAEVGGTVYVDTSLTVKKTAGANSVALTLLEIKGAVFVVRPS